jgi:hypothetical protein
MIELDHDDLRYSGQAGEQVTITVVPEGTTQLVTYTLKGQTKPLLAGASINFALEKQAGDSPMVLQLNLDFDAEGTYRVGVTNVTNEDNNECVHTWGGPPLAIKTFRFFVN